MKVNIFKSNLNENFYDISCQNRKGETEVINTEMGSRLGAIGYAICYIDNILSERSHSDYPNAYSIFSNSELYDIKWKLDSLHDDILFDLTEYDKC